MLKNSTRETLLLLITSYCPTMYLAFIYASLPETVATHFNGDGVPNRYSDKAGLWFPVLLLGTLSIAVYYLIKNLPKIDPKKSIQSPALVQKIAVGMVLFLCLVGFACVQSSKTGSFGPGLMLPAVGLFLSFIGNYMHSIKPNCFIGFRTPWTLENKDNWRATHQLVSKIWMPGGLLMAILTLVLPEEMKAIALAVILIPMIVIPAIFSFRYFKKHQ